MTPFWRAEALLSTCALKEMSSVGTFKEAPFRTDFALYKHLRNTDLKFLRAISVLEYVLIPGGDGFRTDGHCDWDKISK